MTGKERYEQINIPSGLSGVIQQARQRARNQKRRKMMIWRSSSLVAACAAVMITANVPGVAKALSDVPVIGSVVKILQVGGGGERTDGVSVTTTKESDTLNINFQIDGEQITSAPSYTVDHKEGPNRLIFTFNGVRHLDYDKLEQDIKALKNVKEVYQNIILDDSAIGFVVELKDDVDYSVSEYQQPGYIQLKLSSGGVKSTQAHELFFVRSEDMEQGEALAMLAEQYSADGSSVVQTQNGKFTVVMGAFDNRADAEKHLKEFTDREDYSEPLHVDSWMSNENPQ
ncbi:hypothetical protein DC345_21520 [Paenibacillus taichungensis]|uniref:SPOR domain-containing protein n=1 Tax=Paenibacillus taichungensis TaxID=484184 RepID=A0A329QK98_9BACL|nr:hypothetical protein [Paenibacillus taichungensis]RAW12867.1 hypothetical protein DC345_21520 [Paenibacillus taichungensis]